MNSRRVVVIGASAGGIETLRELVRGLPPDLPVPIAVVLHTSPQSPGVLHEILERSGRLPASSAGNGARLEPGHIYVAPPDYHLLLEPGRLRLAKGPRENRFRPAVDPLFRSAAQVYGPGAIGVILSGNLDDGSAGLWAIKQLGGTAIVQHPEDALYPSMPLNALRYIAADHVVPLAEIAPLLARLAGTPPPAAPAPVPEQMQIEVEIAKEKDPVMAGLERIAEPSTFACPECHGVLLKLKEAGRTRFRCHTGHAYSAESLLADVSEGIENALWNAIRALQEGGMLVNELAQHIAQAHAGESTQALEERGQELHKQADAIRDILTSSRALVRSER